MTAAALTLDAALALLDDFEEGDAVGIEFGVDADTAALAIIQSQPQSSNEDRFKRARENKKNELAFFRTQARGLERVLRVLKQQQRRQVSSTQQSVWERTAMRQERDRREAELLNEQLRAMVYATAKRARQLRSLLTVPDALETLVHHKRFHQHSVVGIVADALELQGVVLAVDLMEMQAHATLGKVSDTTEALESSRGEQGCGLVVQSVESALLPYEVCAVSASVWQLLAFGGSPLDTKEAPEDLCCELSRIYTMQVMSEGRCLAYRGTYFYRKRTHVAEGRTTISWASSWTPVKSSDASEEWHESFRREGFVVVSPSSNDRTHSRVEALHRVERDACGVGTCTKGAWGFATKKRAREGVEECVASEMRVLLQGLENQMVTDKIAQRASSVTAQGCAIPAR